MVIVKKSLLSAFVFASMVSVTGFAELTTTVDLTDIASVIRHGQEGTFGMANFLDGSLSFLSEDNDNVKSELELKGRGADESSFEVRRAYIKVRFPWLRLTAGKTRASWGKGFYFNAGDVLFDSLAFTGSLSGSVLRDDTAFMGIAYVPFDSFSFIEAIVLPNPVWIQPGIPVAVDATDMSYGGRIVAKLYDTEFEAGYLYKGQDITNHPYASFSGNLLFDWNLSVSYSISGLAPEFESWKNTLAITEGFSTLINLENSGTLSLRLESVIRPYARWIESTEPLPAPPTPPPSYGIYIFPEIIFSPADTFSLVARSLVCPIDWSGVAFLGAYWNVYQGFTIGFLASGMFGDDNDTYGFNRDGDLAFSISLRYVFGGTTGGVAK
jgi:hypothetical protein